MTPAISTSAPMLWPSADWGWFIGLFQLSYLAVAFVWRSWRVWVQTGINPVVLPAGDDAHAFIGRCFKALIALHGLWLLSWWLAPDEWALWPRLWVYLPAWQHPWVQALGAGTMLLSLAWVVGAQVHMGRSWRVGIDAERETTLVTHGPFARSRNPIFLGMRCMGWGLVAVCPALVTVVLAVCTELLIQIQVRLEETHLRRMHGSTYELYMRTTPRWWRW